MRLIISQCKSQESKGAFFFLFNKKFKLYTALGGPLTTRHCLSEVISLLFSKRMCLISQRYHRAEKQPVLVTWAALSVCPLLGARVTQALAGASDAGGVALGPWQGPVHSH